MSKLASVIILGLALAACPKKSPDVNMGGTETPPAAGKVTADNMAEAPKHALPATLSVALPCNTGAAYAVVDVPEGQDFTVDVKIPEGCAMVHVVKDNGSTNEMPNHETCADAPKGPLAAKGQATRTLIEVHETGACKGVTASIELK